MAQRKEGILDGEDKRTEEEKCGLSLPVRTLKGYFCGGEPCVLRGHAALATEIGKAKRAFNVSLNFEEPIHFNFCE
jgi:hypothetical protein